MSKAKEVPGHNPNNLANKLQVYVDRNGKVLDKGGTPHSSHLSMELTEGDFYIYFDVMTHVMGNGSHNVKVSYKGKRVLAMSGRYTSGPFGTVVTKFVDGKWLKLIEKKL